MNRWTGGSAGSEWKSAETNKAACPLTVFQALFRTGVLTLRTAKPRPDTLEGWTNSPGTVTGSGKALGPVPSEVLPQWIEEETDHPLGAPRKGASDRETWGLGKREAL